MYKQTWVRKDNGIAFINVVMEFDLSLSGFNFKIWQCVSEC